MTTLTISGPRLTCVQITVTATSTAQLVEHQIGSQPWMALLVDGVHYDLILWKHTVGCPEATEALEVALTQVRGAIAMLGTRTYTRHRGWSILRPAQNAPMQVSAPDGSRYQPDFPEGLGVLAEIALCRMWIDMATNPAAAMQQAAIIEA